MTCTPVILALAAAAALAQTKTTGKAGDVVPPAGPVMTIHGLCGSPGPGSCETVITRQQFDTLMDVLRATTRNVVPPMRRSVAEGYSDLLVYADAGKKAGLEKDPRFEQILQLTRMRALADMYRLQQQEQARTVSPEEIKTYYKDNIANFEELRLRRVAVPRNNMANLNDLDFRAKATKLAGVLRDRAAKGEDMDKLQKEAFESLGVKNPPVTLMGPARRGAFDATAEKEIFALKPGNVTTVMELPSVYIIYKLESRRTVPLEEASQEISPTLSRQKLEKLTKGLAASVHVDYNDRYFGPSALSQATASLQNPAPSR